MAVAAGDVFLQLEFLLYAGRYFLQVELHLYAEVGTTETALLCTASSAESSETAETSTVSAEDVAKHGEDVVHGHASAESAERTSVAGCAAHACKAELVVTGTFVRIAQYVIGFGSLLELFFRFLVAGIFVGVILDGFFAVGFLYLIGRCILVDSQYLVVISFSISYACSLFSDYHFGMTDYLVV